MQENNMETPQIVSTEIPSTPITQEKKDVKADICEKLTATGEKILELSSREAEKKDVIYVSMLTGIIQLSIVAAMAGYSEQLSEAANMPLIEALTHPGLRAELVGNSEKVTNMAIILAGLTTIESVAAIIHAKTGIDAGDFKNKIKFPKGTIPVSTHVLPAVGRSLIYVGKIFGSK